MTSPDGYSAARSTRFLSNVRSNAMLLLLGTDVSDTKVSPPLKRTSSEAMYHRALIGRQEQIPAPVEVIQDWSNASPEPSIHPGPATALLHQALLATRLHVKTEEWHHGPCHFPACDKLHSTQAYDCESTWTERRPHAAPRGPEAQGDDIR